MSLSSVVTALNNAISANGTIDLYAASADPALTELRPLLARFGITASFTASNAQLVPGSTSATLEGTANWGLPSAPAANISPVRVRLVCVGAETVAFSLSLIMTTNGWTFGNTFAGLPQTIKVQNQSVQPGPSFLTDIVVNNATFTASSEDEAGLTVAGTLPQTSFWDPWKTLVTPWPLQLSGSAVMPANYNDPPLFDLLASSPVSSIPLANSLLDLAGLSLADVGFQLQSQPADPSPDDPVPAFSQLQLTGRLQVGGLVTRLSCPLLATGRLWHFLVEFEEGGSIVEGMNQLAKLFGLPDLPTPPDFLPIPDFRFDSVEFYVNPGQSLTDFTVTYIGASIISTQPWKTPVPFITLEDVGISWVWGSTPVKGTPTGWLAGSVFGSVVFESTTPIHIDCSLNIPGWSAVAELREGDVIPIGDAFTHYFGSPGPPTKSGMNIVGMGIDADPQEQSYYASADIIFGTPPDVSMKQLEDGSFMLVEDDPVEQGWEINLVVTSITLRELNFEIALVGGELSGGIAATFLFEDGGTPGAPQPPAFMLSAEYPGPAATNPEGWTFAGSLLPGASIDLTAMVVTFLGQSDVPSWVPRLYIDRLYFSFNTGTPTAYSFGGTISGRWQPTIFGTELTISATTALDVDKPGSSPTASGKLSGSFSINHLELSAGLTLGVAEPTYQFKIKFHDLWFQAYTSWRGEEDARHQVISLQLGGVTVGQMLEELVNLAAPTIGYSLDPPWDILNRIELSRFTLTLDPQNSTAELVYAANADLVFMRLDTIGIRYTRGDKSGVSLILTGSLLGQHYDGDELEWDVIDGSPPELPGAGDSFIRLRYLGLGQRVQLSRLPDTVADTLALLEDQLKEPEKGQNPLQGQGVEWSAESQWLIGLDVTLLDTVDIGFIFNDPWLYGLSVALGGEEAGSLAGLRFEILYKKLSDSVGMFRIELSLPEAFRHFEFGEVSVTLGTVVIEIYTNGNFKIDLGFPYDRDFDRSFSVEVFPFLGRGGIYFGLLNGTTSRRVPKVTNGDFSPVIELGVGLAVGVGKDVSVGPLSGGIYVQVEVVFEGVVGWFHPAAAGSSTSVYYWAQGVAAIHGKLYGKVDFAVIKVSVTLEAYAAATVTLEAYQPTLFKLEVEVSAEAEVKILFIKVSFSFDVDLDVSFTVGSEHPTPWVLDADQSADDLPAPSAMLLALGAEPLSQRLAKTKARGVARKRAIPPRRRPDRRRTALFHDHRNGMISRQAEAFGEFDAQVDALNWQPTKTVFPDSPRTAQVFFVPSFTVGDVPLSWTETPPDNASPDYRFAMQMFAPSGVPADALTSAKARNRSAILGLHAEDEDDLDALATDILIQGLLLYALYAIPNGPESKTDTVTAGQLAWLAAMLDDPAQKAAGFGMATLSQFFDTNIHLSVSGLPDGDDPADQSGMAMAVPPVLSWTSPQTGPVDFATDNKIGPLYLWGVQVASALFSPSGVAPPGPPDDPLADYVSFASHLFSDWNVLIAKSAVREAAARLDGRVLPAASATDTLTDIANRQPTATVTYAVRPGDTVTTVADALGATVEELTFLNPALAVALLTTAAGGSVDIVLGISPEVLALDNPGAELKKTELVLGDITISVTATDTLSGLATRYNSTSVAIMSVTGQDVDAKLLAHGSTFDAPAANWTAAPDGCTALRAAAMFYIRYSGVPLVPDPDAELGEWYAQAVADLNSATLSTAAVDPRSHELPPALTLQIPTSYLDATPAANPYITVPGDTLTRIGAALNLEQNQATATGNTGWPVFRDAVTAITGGFAIPAYPGVSILPNETLDILARHTIVNWVSNGAVPPVWSADWAGLASWVGGSTILAPLTLITVPGVTTPTGTNYTFASLATAYGLALTDVGSRLAAVSGLVEDVALTVKHLPADTVQSLLDRVSADAVATIAGEASRLLASGQEIPEPVTGEDGHVHASDTAVAPLFDESRQQWNLTVNAAEPDGVALSLDLTSQASWVALHDTTVVGAGDNIAALAARVPDAFAPQLNRALAAGRDMPAGAIIHAAEVVTLSYSVTNQQVIDDVPATGLAWPPHSGPAPAQVKGESPVTYGLAQHIGLQTSIALPVPGFDVTAKTLSVHPFPPALTTRARAGSPTAYMVYAGNTDTTAAVPFPDATFATLISFTVRRIAEAPGVYQLNGAAIEQMPLLLDLIDYLADPAIPAGTIAKIAMPPSATAADPNGLALVDGEAWFIKSNLSTETVPLSMARALAVGFEDETPPLCRADLSDPESFALLLWEGSAVGGNGYTFGVEGGLSDGAFDANDQATLELVVIAGAQQAAAPSGRTLLKFNTSVLAVDQGIADGATLFAEAHDSTDPTELVAQSLVPAGSTGFDLTLTRPIVPAASEDGDGDDPADEQDQNQLRQHYSLVTATAASSVDCPYAIPSSGLPASPQASDGIQVPAWKRARKKRFEDNARDDPDPKLYWAYQMILPIYRFGPDSVAPDVSGLPLPTDDPYRGLGDASTAPKVDFKIGFGDVQGNRSASGDDKSLQVPAGYTDPLIGPTGWPSVNASYQVSKPASDIILSITFAAKAQALMPALTQRGDAMVQAALRQQDQYAAIYFQYAQPNLAVTAETTLQSGDSLPLDGIPGLSTFAAGAYMVASGATLYRPVMPASQALSDIATNYGVDWDTLAAVNNEVSLKAIFGDSIPITVPAYAVMASGDTATSIAAAVRPGWPQPSASDILSFSENQADLPLKKGAVLSYPPRAITLPATSPVLGTVAVGAATSAGYLASDSASDAILVTNFAFTVDGVTVTVGQTPVSNGGTVTTFAQAVTAFADLGIHLTAYDLGETHAQDTGMLIPGVTAHTAHYVVSGEATLASNPSGATSASLISSNLTTSDLYEAGAMIYLGDFGTGTPHTVTPAPGDLLSGFAARYGCPPAALLSANQSLTVIANTSLAIPGAVVLPASDVLFVPYSLRATDTLSAIAAGFDVIGNPNAATDLAERNRNMPGTVTQGLNFNVTVGGTPVPVDTTGLTSFQAVLSSVKQTAPAATMTEVAAAFETPGRLAAGGLLVCPPARLASATKPSDITTRYGVPDTAFGLANAGTADLLSSGAILSAPDPGIANITTTAHDTLNSVVGRFNGLYLAAGKPATVTVASIITKNPDVTLFKSQARAVLPPADITLSKSLTPAYPGAAFPLTVDFIVTRPAALIHSGFSDSPVASVRAPIAAPASGASMNFDSFEQALTAALPGLRLATAKAEDHTADLWAVNFGTAGITSVDIERSVTFGAEKLARAIALAPLYGQLVSRAQVPIAPLVDGSLDPGNAVNHDYQGIDVEIWAARFLSDFDRLLSPAVAAAINDIVALRPQFVRMMSAKSSLKSAIPNDLEGIFQSVPASNPDEPRAVIDPNLDAGLAEAQQIFGQALGDSLASAWATAAIVQYDATVDSAWSRHTDPTGTAGLYGEGRPKTQNGPPAADNTPPWRLAAGKVDLSQTAPFLTLPLSVSDPGAQSHVALDLVYTVSNLEIHRRPVTVAPGYTRSDWLAMTPVLAGTEIPAALDADLGLSEVPIPLKAFPALPQIVSQSGIADPTDPPTLATAALWSFAFTYSHEHAAQDHVSLTVEFNLSPPPALIAFDVATQDLFTALAQYIAVADDLNGLLTSLTDANSTVDPATLAAAVTTFADLATSIGSLWNIRLPNSPAGPEGGDDWIAAETYPFSAALETSGGELTSYTLTKLGDMGSNSLDWPEVAVKNIAGTLVPLAGQTPDGTSRVYLPESGTTLMVPATRSFSLSWPGLNVGKTQNGRIKLEVIRNADLLGPTGPATAEAFIYRTALVTATDIVTPAISRTRPLAVSGASVEAALQSAFDTLFPPATRPADLKLTFGLFYGYTLVAGNDPLVSELAVGLTPDQTLNSQTAGIIANALNNWQAAVKPNSAGGKWVVSMMLYSAYDPGKRVLLSIDRLSYSLE